MANLALMPREKHSLDWEQGSVFFSSQENAWFRF